MIAGLAASIAVGLVVLVGLAQPAPTMPDQLPGPQPVGCGFAAGVAVNMIAVGATLAGAGWHLTSPLSAPLLWALLTDGFLSVSYLAFILGRPLVMPLLSGR